MAAEPNLQGLARGAYTAAGALLVGYGFFGVEAEWARYLLPSLGGVLLIEGLIGYSLAAAMLGIGKKESR